MNNNLTPEQLDKMKEVVDTYYPDHDQDMTVDDVDEADFVTLTRWHPVDLLNDFPERFADYDEAKDWLDDNAGFLEEAATTAVRDAIGAII